MDALNLSYNTPTPDGGVIVKDGKGDPTGILHENAVDLAYPLIALSIDSAKTAILAAQDHAFRWGITNFHVLVRAQPISRHSGYSMPPVT